MLSALRSRSIFKSRAASWLIGVPGVFWRIRRMMDLTERVIFRISSVFLS
jgi:hypothetical protein